MPQVESQTVEELPVEELKASLLSLDRLAVRRTMLAAAASSTPVTVIDSLVVPVLERIGQGWQAGEISLAEVYMAGRLVEETVDEVLGAPAASARASAAHPKIAMCVLEDSHGLGKRIVSTCLRVAGFEVLDLGLRRTVEDIVEEVRAKGIEILLVSTLMLRAALAVGTLTRRLAEEDLDHVKVVVGGAPFRYDPNLWREVGAHAWGYSASEAIEVVSAMARA
ncbi:MAG: cobalamin-binding protein [Actinobacteria bacterium HGW-Actinobacteria-7]|nr:MAG: cobalamin-binding protein [Actinobacteria bacterium HGW-Actinobacteria-7]